MTSVPSYREVGFLPEDEQEVLDSPDGDPAKRGTITVATPILRGDALPPSIENETREPSRLLVAQRHQELHVASSLEAGLADLYEDDRRTREAAEALLDEQSDQRKRPR